jgi:hypothetical protein
MSAYRQCGCRTGLIPVFRTEPSTIFVFRKVRKDVEEQAHGSADDRGGYASDVLLTGDPLMHLRKSLTEGRLDVLYWNSVQ